MDRALKSIDLPLILLYLVIVLFGIFNIESADHSKATNQILWLAIFSVFVLIPLSLINSHFFESFSIVLYIVGILSLVGVLLLGKEINGAKAWYSFGPISIQPAEFTKYFTAILIASYFDGKQDSRFSIETFFVVGLILIIPISLIGLQPDLGSILVFISFLIPLYREGLSPVIFFIGFFLSILFLSSLLFPFMSVVNICVLTLTLFSYIVYRTSRNDTELFKITLAVLIGNLIFFAAQFSYQLYNGVPFSTLSVVAFLGNIYLLYIMITHEVLDIKNILSETINQIFLYLVVISMVAGISYSSQYAFNNILKSHHRERIMVLFEGAEKYRHTSGYNLLYSKTAIGSGGWLGRGHKHGTITSGKFVPEQHTDYIFTTVGEEWGFVGSALLIIIYCLFIGRIYLLAEKQKSTFNRFFGYSVASIILFHFCLNISMVIGLFPTIGIPLPFFSYGGSSFLAFSLMLFTFIKMSAKDNRALV